MKNKRFVRGLRKTRVLVLGAAFIGMAVFGFWLGGVVSKHPSQVAAQDEVPLPPPVNLSGLVAIR